ncbi:hypothetical protein PGQ11_010228 [Apiospora arundinis]|uniref:Uncharacterized protein n=1 Tax=Apiospora arundinis TaxID=335852 RepID=A0ABR2I927_9PEZI
MTMLDKYVEYARSSRNHLQLLACYTVQVSTHPSLLWNWLVTFAYLVATSVKALLYGIPFFIAFVFTTPLQFVLEIGDYIYFAINNGVNVIIVRHGEAVSNVRSGEWRSDGLTDFGIKATQDFARHMEIKNVYSFVSSQSIRSIQTVQIIENELTTRANTRANVAVNRPNIHYHPDFRELTDWPHDQPINMQHREDMSYTYEKLCGGSGEDSETLTGKQVVDLNDSGCQAMSHTLDLFPHREYLKNRVKKARIWLREIVKEALAYHRRNRIYGRPTIVLVCHGGFLNPFLGEYRCDFTRSQNSENWEWASSTTLRNLDAVVYSFASLTDPDAQLVEQEKSDEWSEVLGQHYRHLGSERKCGGDVNHEREYWRFLERAAERVRNQDKLLLNRLFRSQGWQLTTSNAKWTLEPLA